MGPLIALAGLLGALGGAGRKKPQQSRSQPRQRPTRRKADKVYPRYHPGPMSPQREFERGMHPRF